MIRNRTAIIALLTALNFINYLDRYIVAAVLPPLREELVLTPTEGGLLATVFLLGYFVTSPFFGSLGDRMSRKRLIAAGVFVWSAATICSGLATNFWTLVTARAFVGIGEASYATLAPTIIDDITPPEKKGKALAIFFLATPLGSALGYVLGGQIQAHWGWREAFFVGGGPGIVLAFTVLLIDEPVRKVHDVVKISVGATIGKLMRIPLYRRAVLGYCAHTGAIGAFSHWAPTFLVDRYSGASIVSDAGKAALASASFLFGTVTVVAGAIGTFLGGYLSDRAVARLPSVAPTASHEDLANRVAANAQLRVCMIGVAIAAPMTALAFFMPTQALFFTCAGIAEVGLFMSTAPINAIMLRTAPAFLRASAMAVGIFMIHLLGDLWSPTVLGALQEVLPITLAMMLLPVGFGLATYIWFPRRSEAT